MDDWQEPDGRGLRQEQSCHGESSQFAIKKQQNNRNQPEPTELQADSYRNPAGFE
ncbi:MAG: hypothetical protein R3C59_01430 [Planctomycetaceae bacterium]